MKAKITLLPGDGIGPEVVGEAKKVLTAVARQYNHTFTFSEALAGGIAIDQTGNPLPDETTLVYGQFDRQLQADHMLQIRYPVNN